MRELTYLGASPEVTYFVSEIKKVSYKLAKSPFWTFLVWRYCVVVFYFKLKKYPSMTPAEISHVQPVIIIINIEVSWNLRVELWTFIFEDTITSVNCK